MKPLSLFIAFLFSLAFYAQAQVNLIKNPGLEEYTCCPNNMGMINCATNWTQPTIGNSSSEYLNTCGIDSLAIPYMLPYFQHAYFGNGYAGILIHDYFPPYASYREYIQGTLSEPLIARQCYYCEFWVELFTFKNTSPFAAIDAISIFFSDTLPKQTDSDAMAMYFAAQINNPIGRIITDTSNWTKICGTFYATGGEKFFTVGTFKQENEINSIYFGTSQINRSYYFFDNFSLCPCEDTITPNEPPPMLYVPNIFSPNHDGHNDGFRLRSPQIDSLHLQIYNRWGNKVFETNNPNDAWDGTYQSKDCETGNYVWWAEITFKNGKKEIRKGNVSLVR